MSFDLMQINAAIAAHGEAIRVVIADIKGSSPREIGASMLLWPGGQSGSIGGGALEYQASLAPQPGLRRYPLGPELGQCCGGHVTLVTEHFTSPVDATDVFIRRIEGDMAMPLQMAQLQKGWRNGSADPAALICTAGWLAETLTPAAHPLWIWGAGHVGRAVVHIASQMPDLEVTWIDTSPDRFPQTPPEAVTLVPAENPAPIMAHAPRHAQHLIFTYAHSLDLELCHAALLRGFDFCGLIGSASKWARFQRRLMALGHTPGAISKITCPIGDPNLGKQPISIAIGVTQALLSHNMNAKTRHRSALS